MILEKKMLPYHRVFTFADFIPEKWKSGDIEIACGNVENPGKFGKSSEKMCIFEENNDKFNENLHISSR